MASRSSLPVEAFTTTMARLAQQPLIGQKNAKCNFSRLPDSTLFAPRITHTLPHSLTRVTGWDCLCLMNPSMCGPSVSGNTITRSTFMIGGKGDIDSMVMRDRNHPSFTMWGIGNEIPEVWTPAGAPLAKQIAEQVRSLDSTRPLTQAFPGATYGPDSDAAMAQVDIAGYNYNLAQNQAEDHKRVPARRVADPASVTPARGGAERSLTKSIGGIAAGDRKIGSSGLKPRNVGLHYPEIPGAEVFFPWQSLCTH